jgi:tetratricopeptide (TPR) repeat protein
MPRAAAIGWLALILFVPSRASSSVAEQDRASDRAMLDQVKDRLLATVNKPSGMPWPPEFALLESSELLARVYLAEGGRPRVEVSTAILDRVVDDEPDRLAFIIGHELAHLELGHLGPRPASVGGEAVVVGPGALIPRVATSRLQEFEADSRGARLAVASGYSHRQAIKLLRSMRNTAPDLSGFEGRLRDHPSWVERLARLDVDRRQVWEAMSAFEYGVGFLSSEQYNTAERCFREVKNEFPDSAEALANFGYALLMQFCDNLDPGDLKRYGFEQIVTGGFYLRSDNLLDRRVRGPDEELWFEALGAFKDSLRIKPNQPLVKANLGLAYLLRPIGKDLGSAAKFLEEAARDVESDENLPRTLRATVMINSGVALRAGGRAEEGDRRIAQGERLLGDTPRPRPVQSALLFYQAGRLASSPDAAKRRDAAVLLERYLGMESPSSLWRSIARERYDALCRGLGREPLPDDRLALKTPPTLRMVSSASVGGDKTVTLDEKVLQVRADLGPAESLPVVPRTNLVRLRYPELGLELVADDRVLVIGLKGPKAPPLPIRGVGPGGPTVILRVGMSDVDVDRTLGDRYEFLPLFDANIHSTFYRDLGLAIRILDRRVEEILILHLPRGAVVR